MDVGESFVVLVGRRRVVFGWLCHIELIACCYLSRCRRRWEAQADWIGWTVGKVKKIPKVEYDSFAPIF